MGAEATLKMILLGEDRSAGKALKGVGGEAEGARGKLSKFARIAGTALVGGLVAGGAAMVKFGQQASDLSETQSKVAQIFGKDSTKALDEFASGAARSLGQSKQQALDAAATFGIIGKSAGKSGKDLVDFSTQMVGLAGDMASFNNSTPEEAIEAIGAAMRGEAEPIRKYGVLLDDATLRASALKLGLIKSVKEGLTPQQKALAAQAEILRQTKDQQGDFARTSGGLANQQRILKAELNNMTTELGERALPIMVKGTHVLNDLVVGFQEGTGAGGEIRDVLEEIAGVGKGVYNFFNGLPGPVKKYGAEILVAAVVTSRLRTALSPLSGGLSAISANFRSAETRSAGFRASMRGLGSTVTNVAGAGGMLLLADGAKDAGKQIGTLKMAAGGALSGAALGAFAGPPGAAVGAALGGLAGGFIGLRNEVNHASDAGKVTLPTWRQYMGTLDGVKAATTRATREMVLQRLESSGLLSATRRLGLSDRMAVSAMMGNHAARVKLTNAMRTSTRITQNQKDALTRETGAVGRSRLAQLKHNEAVAGSAAELKRARRALRSFMAQPASKRVSITGVEGATATINALRASLQSLWSTKGASELTSGPGGLDVLLNPSRHAVGTRNFSGGLTWVGERGPELIAADRGARIYTAGESARMVAGGGEAEGTITIVVKSAETGETIETKLVKVKRTSGRKRLAFESS